MKTQFPIQRFNELPTPFYYYDMDRLDEQLNAVTRAANSFGFHIHYALKANSNLPILKRIRAAGLGADCVSGPEIGRAIEAGFSPGTIVFAGVGKQDQEIRVGLENQILAFNCESVQEIGVIRDLAFEMDTTARIAFRVNPHIDAGTHKYITTGVEENKFGLPPESWKAALQVVERSDRLELTGMHVHIGSQITDLKVFEDLCLRVNEITDWFAGQGIVFKHINLGGGFGVDHENPDGKEIDFNAVFGLIDRNLKREPDQQIHFEPGRILVAQSGSLISRVLFVKESPKNPIIVLDAGMTELIRPALYQAYHKIENLSREEHEQPYDVVGPICESSDYFGKTVDLPETLRGDLMAIRTAGAYGEVMQSGYNLRPAAQAYYSNEI